MNGFVFIIVVLSCVSYAQVGIDSLNVNSNQPEVSYNQIQGLTSLEIQITNFNNKFEKKISALKYKNQVDRYKDSLTFRNLIIHAMVCLEEQKNITKQIGELKEKRFKINLEISLLKEIISNEIQDEFKLIELNINQVFKDFCFSTKYVDYSTTINGEPMIKYDTLACKNILIRHSKTFVESMQKFENYMSHWLYLYYDLDYIDTNLDTFSMLDNLINSSSTTEKTAVMCGDEKKRQI